MRGVAMVAIAESKKDLVECEELLNQNVTWADPDPFVQLSQKNPEKIGVANPYVLAPLLLNRKINWSTGNAKKFLMDAFATTGLTEFADIFNPDISVIFPHNQMNRIQISSMLSDSGGTVHGGETHEPVPGSASSYGPIEPNRNYPPPALPTPSDPPGGESALPFKKIKDNTIKDVIDDTMQGISPDCYFLAALYSRAWCNYPAFPPTPPTTPVCSNGSNITFYNTTGASVIKCATRRFPLDSVKQPACAQMTSDWELWSTLYEKAYAMFLNRPPSNLPGANGTATDPDLTNNNNLPANDPLKLFPSGDPLLSLFHITKMKWDFTSNNTIGQPSAFLTASFPQFGFNTSYEALNKNLTGKIGDSRKTIYPTVAWTYTSRPACSDTVFGAGKNPYGNDLIVARHSYSVLGSLTVNSKDYIVLRNPWGPNYIGDPAGIITGYLASGPYTPATGISFDLGRKPDGGTTDGIFALETKAFDCCFRGFGWVQFR
jgi:hypothetical protein